MQTASIASLIGEDIDASVHACIGGTSLRDDIRTLRTGCPIIAGTPGRVLDMIEKGHLDTRNIKIFIVDEADQMLSQGFEEQFRNILYLVPKEAQIGLFSATYPMEAIEIAHKFMTDPLEILTKKEELTLEGLRQFYIDVEREDFKFETLMDLHECVGISQCIIFCNTKV